MLPIISLVRIADCFHPSPNIFPNATAHTTAYTTAYTNT